MSGPLGFIPAWQFSADPNINPMVNPHVSMPKGWYQAGAYFSQPAYNNGYTGTDSGGVTMNGLGSTGFNCLNCAPSVPTFGGTQLGFVMIDEGKPPVGVPWGMEKEGSMMYNRGVEYLRTGNWEAGKDLGFSLTNPFEDSFVWKYRKPLVVGGVVVAGLALLGLASSLLG